MKIVDRLRNFEAQMQEEYGDSSYYSVGKVALKGMVVGGAVIAGGAIAGTAGIQEGYDITLLAGLPVYGLGGATLIVCAGLDALERDARERDKNEDDPRDL